MRILESRFHNGSCAICAGSLLLGLLAGVLEGCGVQCRCPVSCLSEDCRETSLQSLREAAKQRADATVVHGTHRELSLARSAHHAVAAIQDCNCNAEIIDSASIAKRW